MSLSINAFAHSVLLTAMLGALSACGGGSSDDTPGGTNPLIIGSSSGQPASGASTSDIQARALSGATEGLQINLGNLQGVNDDVVLESPLVDPDTTIDNPVSSELDGSADSFMAQSLGVSDPMATVVREGDVITIDPDENSLCADSIPLLDDTNDDAEACRQLMADLTVQIDAASEDTGVITWLFQSSPVMLVGYAPDASSYELDLAGLQRVWQRASELQEDVVVSQATMSGRLRLESRVSNDSPGAEAGSMSLKVTQAISIQDTDTSTGFSLAPSTVLAMSADAATRDASLVIDWGALSTTTASGDSDGNSSLQTFAMGGLTGTLNVSDDDQSVSISNVGIADVPITLTVDSIETVSAEFDTLGVSIDNETGALVINGALGVRVAVNNLAGIFEDFGPEFIANMDLSAPNGTAFLEHLDGTTEVTAGGPLNATYSVIDNGQNVPQSVSIGVGECFDQESGDFINTVVATPCN